MSDAVRDAVQARLETLAETAGRLQESIERGLQEVGKLRGRLGVIQNDINQLELFLAGDEDEEDDKAPQQMWIIAAFEDFDAINKREHMIEWHGANGEAIDMMSMDDLRFNHNDRHINSDFGGKLVHAHEHREPDLEMVTYRPFEEMIENAQRLHLRNVHGFDAGSMDGDERWACHQRQHDSNQLAHLHGETEQSRPAVSWFKVFAYMKSPDMRAHLGERHHVIENLGGRAQMTIKHSEMHEMDLCDHEHFPEPEEDEG